MLLLGTDPSVGMCVIYCPQLVVWIYSKAHNFTSDPSCPHPPPTHTHSFMEGAPFITVTFSFHTQPKEPRIYMRVSCAPALKHNSGHLTFSDSRSTPCSSTSTFSWESSLLIFDLCRGDYEGTPDSSRGTKAAWALLLVYDAG